MEKFKSICKQNFRSGLLRFNINNEYRCEYDITEYGKFVYVYAFDGKYLDMDRSYIYLSSKQFNMYFKTLSDIRKEKIKKLNSI